MAMCCTTRLLVLAHDCRRGYGYYGARALVELSAVGGQNVTVSCAFVRWARSLTVASS